MSRTIILTFALALISLVILFGSIDAQAAGVTDTIGKKLESGLNSIIDSVTAFLSKVIEIIADAFLAPFRALTTVWENWSKTLSGWAGPIIAGFVIIVVLLMIRVYSLIDEAGDRASDWISQGDK